MTDLRKAAEMALKALEEINKLSVGEIAVCLPAEIDDAMEALRQALSQHVDAVNISQKRVDKTVKREHDRAVELAQAYERGWNAALAQTEQEPVGYINGMHGGYMVFTPINPSAVYLNGTALYTAPPKREWVGYTNEDRKRIVPMLVQSLINHDEKTMAGLLNAILIDIEQQLKEKNT